MNLNRPSVRGLIQWPLYTGASLYVAACSFEVADTLTVSPSTSEWVKIDDFESPNPLEQWILTDARNDTNPRIENPQVTEVHDDLGKPNHYLIKKPAAEGVAGNRKALSYRKLPVTADVGKTYTFYTRINVEYFPNNHVFGLSNLDAAGIDRHDYNAFEPTLRVTDKLETDGSKNDGTLMVRKGAGYKKVSNFQAGRDVRPLQTNTWYEIWYVVNNASIENGGQNYDVYLRGGDEFPHQRRVFEKADFRMRRELPLNYFLANCNTGPVENPYGNGGLRYDDLYMAEGELLSAPVIRLDNDAS